jgi:hypothetical protein
MRVKSLSVAFILISFVQLGIASCSRVPSELESNASWRNACGEFLEIVENTEKRGKLVDWADNEVFSREFSASDFGIGHFSGPGHGSKTFNIRAGALRLPDWLPNDIEVRVVNGEPEIETIFIGGGRYRGLVIARSDWETSIDGRRLKEEMIKLKVGRLGLICYTDS